MKNELSNCKRRTPIVVWCVRLCFLAIVYIFATGLLSYGGMDIAGQLFFGGLIVIGSAALVASFVHLRGALVVVVLSILTIPLIVFLSLDIFILRTAWWEWFMLFVQMGIPISVACYMWASPRVKNYYSRSI